MEHIKINEKLAGERLDKVLAKSFTDYSRSSLSKLIKDGQVLVNGKHSAANYRLQESDNIKADLSLFKIKPSKINIPVIYEDDNVIVVNKPAGVLSHSKGVLNSEATVASWLSFRFDSQEWKENISRRGIVHRLDRFTSGVMICAKNEDAHKFLQKQFSARRVVKRYLALVSSRPKHREALIDMPIERDPKKPAAFRVGPNGKPAKTYYRALDERGTVFLLELTPETGRTHQLRVHLKHIGCPIVGDRLYGGRKAIRLMLHAKTLELNLPYGTRKTFIAKPPLEFKEY